jgi:hypothetical protein
VLNRIEKGDKWRIEKLRSEECWGESLVVGESLAISGLEREYGTEDLTPLGTEAGRGSGALESCTSHRTAQASRTTYGAGRRKAVLGHGRRWQVSVMFG